MFVKLANGPTHKEALSEWSKKFWLHRLFLPGDLRNEASATGKEELVCEGRTNEHLEMQEEVRRQTLKIRESKQYSTNLPDRPREFKKQTIKFMGNSTKVAHRDCEGSGVLSCPTEMICRTCNGRKQREEACNGCAGRGKGDPYGDAHANEICISCLGSGVRTFNCSDCDFRGRVDCDQCGGTGRVHCANCDGMGEVVDAVIFTRRFSPFTEKNYRLPRLKVNEFKNGLDRKHFNKLAGDVQYSRPIDPSRSNTVLERETLETYNVVSYYFAYKDSGFCLNVLSSAAGRKYVPFRFPISYFKLAIAGGTIGALLVAGALAFESLA